MKNKRLIYSLCCPFTGDIHYIGKTTKGMSRPLQHATDSHSAKVKEWVEGLRDIGHKPEVKILETVSDVNNLDSRERYWIQYRLNKGDLLLNDCLVTPLLISNDLDKIIGDGEGMEMERIGRFIKERRGSVGLTQEEFADKTAVALTVLRKIEQGKSNINLEGLLSILRMFGCTLDVVKMVR
jgi:DNA-binding XRE family transcriptional regulator